MSNQDQAFTPLTPALGIAGSSYQIQLGKVNNYWAIRLVRGKGEVLASKVFNAEQTTDIPLTNHLTGWVLSVLTIPNINTYQIQKTIGALRQNAVRNIEDQKRAKASAGKAESRDAKLEKIPKNVQIKRPQAKGFVKEDETISEEDRKAAASQSAALAASNVGATTTGQTSATISPKGLASIPMGEGFVPQPFSKDGLSSRRASPARVTDADLGKVTHNILNSPLIQKTLERVDQLEYKVQTLEAENVELRKMLKKLQ